MASECVMIMDTAGARTAARRADSGTGGAEQDGTKLRLWLRMLTCTHLIGTEVRRRLRAEFGTSLARFDVLAQLDRAADGLTMGQLSRHLMVSSGNVTGLIGRLVHEGLVERRADPNDRRAQIVRLTPAGKRNFDAMVPVHFGWINELLAHMDQRELAALMDLLSTLKDGLPRPDPTP